MFKMALYQNHVILVQWYNWYKKVQLTNLRPVARNDEARTCYLCSSKTRIDEPSMTLNITTSISLIVKHETISL